MGSRVILTCETSLQHVHCLAAAAVHLQASARNPSVYSIPKRRDTSDFGQGAGSESSVVSMTSWDLKIIAFMLSPSEIALL